MANYPDAKSLADVARIEQRYWDEGRSSFADLFGDDPTVLIEPVERE